MSVTIAVVANIYNEENALPGWIESALQFADWVGLMHAGPQGEHSTDRTLDIAHNWRIPVEFCAIDDGFGVVRTKTLRMVPAGMDYIVLLDADERLFPLHRLLRCSGQSTPHSEVDRILQMYDFRDLSKKQPAWDEIAKLGQNLTVDIGEPYNQGARLREILEHERPDAVCTVRRHWHDFSFRRPTQNWHTEPDYQMRIVRNDPSIHFGADKAMHERLQGADKIFWGDMQRGPYVDHFHFVLKVQETMQRHHDVLIYDAIHEGRTPPTWEEFKKDV